MILTAIAATALTFQAAPEAATAENVPSATTATDTSAKEEAGPDTSDEMVCKYQTGTGTRFKKKTCLTRAQWVAIAEQNKRDYSESRDRPVIETRRDQ